MHTNRTTWQNMNALVQSLRRLNKKMALAESVTCGMAVNQLGSVRDISEVLQGAVVCYNEAVKTGLMGLQPELIAKHTAESQEVTDALARKLARQIKADIYAAITGLAAPGGSETSEKPVGSIFISVYYKNRMFRQKKVFRGRPKEIRKKACRALYLFMLEIIGPVPVEKDRN